jgi:hypothetical protein
MKRKVTVLALGLVLVAGVAIAQQQAPAQPGTGHGQHHMQGGMCPMMGGGMMSGGMMGMMGGQSDSPRMMQMRGEMMKAVGEVLAPRSWGTVKRSP